MSALERLRPLLATACLPGAGLHARIGPLLVGWRAYIAEGQTRDIVTLEAGSTSFDRLFTQLWPALVWSAFQLSGSRELSRPTAPAAILNPQEALPRC